MGAKAARKAITRAVGNAFFHVATIVAAGISFVATLVIALRIHYYDPKIEHTSKCPACGHRDCNLKFIFTQGPEQGAIECYCTTCGAKFYQPLMMPAKEWLTPNAK